MNEFEKLSAERKHLQSIGEVPEWMTTQGYIMFKRKYAYNKETVKGAFERISSTLSKHYDVDVDKAKEKFFNLLWKGYLSPSTPVYCNTGTNQGLTVSCAGNYFPDSVSGFYSAHSENAILSKLGFGTSSYLGDIRPRGSVISSGGIADGVVPVIDTAIDVMTKISQGSSRRGQWAGYIEVDHGDFWEVAGYILKNPTDANIGWIFTDNVIERLKNKDEEMIKRWNHILYLRCRTGKGYIWKSDTANKLAPQAVKNSNIKIRGSNLCVAPETQILTRDGYVPIAELAGESVDIWNGEEWSTVDVVQTGKHKKLIKVKTTFGYELECTPYHKFYIFNGYGRQYKQVEAQELKVGDKLAKFDLPVIQGHKQLDKAYLNGFFTGDGCYYKGKNIVYLYDKKRILSEDFKKYPHLYYTEQNNQDREVFHMLDLKEKFFVPTCEYDVESRLEWLAGWLDADGCIYRNGINESITGASTELSFLKEVQMMLQTLGVSCKISTMAEGGYKKLPANDGTGELKDFWCQESYRLLISSYDSYKLLELGLKFKRLDIKKRRPQRDAKQFVIVDSIVDEGRYDDTYCFTEPKRHMGMFNGILTGQCNEIALVSDRDHSFTCVLSSLNLFKYDEFEEDTIFWSIVFLDCVVSEMLLKSDSYKELERIERFTKKARALGLGVMGFHSYLQKKMIPFDGFEAHMLNTQIFKKIKDESTKASKHLADIYGEPEWCKGTGLRNATLTAIAPTMSSSILCGSVSQGIEPIISNVFIQRSAAGEFTRINPQFMEIAKKHGKYTQEEMDDIAINHDGSVQHLDWLTQEEKDVFKTAYEIDQHALLRLASVRQQFICQGQSLNLFFSSDEDEEYIAEIHKEALLDSNIKGLYYLRSSRGVKASKGCVACE